MAYDFIANKRKDKNCTGILKCRMIEPALAAFFGIKDPTEIEVPVEFTVHNTWCFDERNKDQYLTLTKINGIDLEYKVPYTSQRGRVDIWNTVDSEEIILNITIGIDSFYITVT